MTEEFHPDRLAATLAARSVLLDGEEPPPSSTPVGDARVDLQLLRFAADRALAERGTPAARAWLDGLDTPDLRAGTVQDGTARGLMARLEEAISLCDPATTKPTATATTEVSDDEGAITGKELRRKRDILVASGGVRIRFSRKGGILVVDRSRDLNVPNCIQFEDQGDVGCLDGFRATPDTRPRWFSPAFLSPARLVHNSTEDRLELEGRLGRGVRGFPCRLTIVGRKDEPGVRLTVRVENRLRDHRLRIRFVGLTDDSFVSHRGTPGFCAVRHGDRSFLAATLVRACGKLRAGEDGVPTPGAQMLGIVEHSFGLGLDV